MVRLYNENPNPKIIAHIAEILRNGGIIIYPTDTVYAIGCDMYQPRAIEKICRFRGLDPRKAQLAIVCHDLSSVSEYARIDNSAFKLLKQNLPGAFTFILPGSNRLPKLFKDRKTIGIRIPDNNIVRAITAALGNPLMTASIKDDELSEYETDPELLQEKYGHMTDIIINGGMGGTTASTIVDCTGDEPQITRQGAGELTI